MGSRKSLLGSKNIAGLFGIPKKYEWVVIAVVIGLILCVFMTAGPENFTEGFKFKGKILGGGYCHPDWRSKGKLPCVPDGTYKGKQKDKANELCDKALMGGCIMDEMNTASKTVFLDEAEKAKLKGLKCKFGKREDHICSADAMQVENTCRNAGKDSGCKWADCNFSGTEMAFSGKAEDGKVVVDLNPTPLIEEWWSCKIGGDWHNNRDELGKALKVAGITRVGIPRGANEGLTQMKPDDIKKRNGISASDVATLAKTTDKNGNLVFPKNWVNGMNSMIEWCGDDGLANTQADKMKKGVIGWQNGFRSMQCLNHNPTHDVHCLTKSKQKKTVRCGQKGKRGEPHYGDSPSAMDIIDSACSMDEKGLDLVGMHWELAQEGLSKAAVTVGQAFMNV